MGRVDLVPLSTHRLLSSGHHKPPELTLGGVVIVRGSDMPDPEGRPVDASGGSVRPDEDDAPLVGAGALCAPVLGAVATAPPFVPDAAGAEAPAADEAKGAAAKGRANAARVLSPAASPPAVMRRGVPATSADPGTPPSGTGATSWTAYLAAPLASETEVALAPVGDGCATRGASAAATRASDARPTVAAIAGRAIQRAPARGSARLGRGSRSGGRGSARAKRGSGTDACRA
ncbi:MAG: hypothetical protein KGJ98_03660 [Chloroflexota bacterium]|nr:hypothetical protein [Chloroflexota bacterium]